MRIRLERVVRVERKEGHASIHREGCIRWNAETQERFIIEPIPACERGPNGECWNTGITQITPTPQGS